MTKTEALNMLLLSSGQLPVQDYNSNHPDAISARSYIERWSQQSQHRGWYFNTFYALDLVPNGDGEIALPTGAIRVDITSHTDQGAVRSGKLWNSTANSFKWEEPMVGNVFVQLDFDECPIVMQTIIAYSALSEWQAFHEGDQLKIQQAEKVIATSRVTLNREQIRFENNNALTRPTAKQFLGRQMRPGTGFNPILPGGKVF